MIAEIVGIVIIWIMGLVTGATFMGLANDLKKSSEDRKLIKSILEDIDEPNTRND